MLLAHGTAVLWVAVSHLFSASEFFSFSSSSGAKSPAASAIMSLRICSRAAAFFFMSSWLTQRRETKTWKERVV